MPWCSILVQSVAEHQSIWQNMGGGRGWAAVGGIRGKAMAYAQSTVTANPRDCCRGLLRDSMPMGLKAIYFQPNPGSLPDILFGDGPLIVPIQHVHHAHLLQRDGGKLADGDVDDGPFEPCGDVAENRPRRFGRYIDDKFLDGVIEAGQQ